MKRQLPRVVTAMLMAAAALPAYANDWGQVATVSSTLGINDGRLCVGEASRGDLGCPTYAPSLTTAGDISVTGNLSADTFIGDGSGLTGLSAGDRITSSTFAVIANETTNYVSLSTAGTTWGYFNELLSYLPTLWAGRVSATNISATTAHFAGNVGIRTSAPITTLDVNGSLGIRDNSDGIRLYNTADNNWTRIYTNEGSGKANLHIDTGIYDAFVITNPGAVGIGGVSAPAATLQVSGTFTVSSTITNAAPALYVSTSGNVGIGTTEPSTSLHIRNAGASGKAFSNNTGLIVENNGASGSYYAVQVATAGANDAFVVRNDGKVGIGTSAPGSSLDVAGPARVTTYSQGYWAVKSPQGTYARLASMDVANTVGQALVSTNGWISASTNALVQDSSLYPTWMMVLDSGGSAQQRDAFQVRRAAAGATLASNLSTLFHINASGNVGIGTTNPNAKLDVAGTISATGISVTGTVSATYFEGNGSRLTGLTTTTDRITSGTSSIIVSQSGHISFTTAGTERMVINASGNVGIGTTNPGAPLHVWNTGLIAKFGTDDAASSWIQTADNRAMFGYSVGNDRAVVQARSGKGIEFNSSNTFGSGNLMVIRDTGNVGIGTTAPSEKLVVYGNAIFSQGINVGDAVNAPVSGGMRIARAGTSEPFVLFENADGASALSQVRGINGGGIRFTNGSSVVSWMDITNAGNVGIGTTSPGKTLDVSGTAQIVSRTLIGGSGTPSGTLHVSGSLMVAGNDNIGCTAATSGLMRRDPSTGRMQLCR